MAENATSKFSLHLQSQLAVTEPKLSMIGNTFFQSISYARNKHWSTVFYISILYIFITSVMTPEAPTTISGCFQCITLMNRQWKNNLNKCSGNRKDCGKCVDGYFATKEIDRCEPPEMVITVERNDKSALIPFERSVIIQCQFDHPVDCAWNRKKYNLDVKGRYSYVNNDNGKHTLDCSLRIDKFSDIDIGTWDCQSLGDSAHEAMKSTIIQLNKVEDPSMEEFPKNSSVVYGEKVLIECKFNAEVECQWLLNDVIAPESRYHFLEKSLQRRKNCSVEILAPSTYEQHIEVWTCNYRGSSSTLTSSNTARITMWKKPSSPEITIDNSTPVKRSIINTALGKQRISCSSFNGWPAAELRWEIEGQNVQPNTSSKVGENVISTAITLDSLQLQHFKSGTYTLKCVASHPAFQTEMVVEEPINIINEDLSSTEKNDNFSNVLITDSPVNKDEEEPNFDLKIIVAVAIFILILLIVISIVIFLVRCKNKNAKRNTQQNQNIKVPNDGENKDLIPLNPLLTGRAQKI